MKKFFFYLYSALDSECKISKNWEFDNHFLLFPFPTIEILEMKIVINVWKLKMKEEKIILWKKFEGIIVLFAFSLHIDIKESQKKKNENWKLLNIEVAFCCL